MATTPNGEPTRASGSGPSKSKTSAEDMVRVTRDAKIIDLRRDGHTYVQIGSIVGVSKSTVADAVKRWMDANGPSADQVEELRQFQGAQLDAYQAKLAPHLMRKLRNDDGEIIYDSAGDDRQPIESPTFRWANSGSVSSSAARSSTASTSNAATATRCCRPPR